MTATATVDQPQHDRVGPERTSYRLVPAQPPGAAPSLDEAQRRVVDHRGGPLLVLAGPGTGKTTTLVEAVARRIEDGARPEQVLALTFSRKAAEQLRDRVTARLGRTMSTSLCSTFHSFAYGLVRRYAPAELYAAPLRLLSAPEADVVLRELLTDSPESVRWPDGLRRALGTRGFAREVGAVLARAREKNLDGPRLVELGRAHDAPELSAAGLFLEQYLDNLDSQGATDYADLIRRAVIEAEDHRDELRAQLAHVFVDEYQDTDPGQVRLLQALAGDGRNLVVVGDPHQSIYAFRGAEVRGILEFPSAFPRADGSPADVLSLRTTRRFGPRLLVATQRLAGRLGLPGSIDADAREAFLAPRAEPAAGVGDGRVEVVTFDTERSEAEHLADRLRRAHLEDGVGWDEMAVLVRSGRGSIPPLRRALTAAGVPVEVAADDTPLVRDPAVLPLLDALRAVLHIHDGAPDDADRLEHVDATRAEALLTGPLGGLDAGALRRLLRRLREREKRRAEAADAAPEPSRALLRRIVVERGFVDGVPGPEAAAARTLAGLLHGAATQLAERSGTDPSGPDSSGSDSSGSATAEQVLWTLWSGTDWPSRLRARAERGGGAARRAHRDLDALVALFEAAARAEEQRDHRGVRTFLETLSAQEIPADTLADRGVRGAAVRLLTAHRSKGLEWRFVAVAHVQEEGWPDLRRRATLLRADRLGTDGLVPPASQRELLAEERRLFYVACTRARERLLVTAVASAEDEGEQPSRFLDELGVRSVAVSGRPARPLSLPGLVAELRRTATDPEQPEGLRRAATERLARLATQQAGGRPLVPRADPGTWWGTRAASRSAVPVRDPERPVPVSASVLRSLQQCPARWFLEREAGGVAPAHQAANLGQLVHALAHRVASGELPAGPEDLELLMEHVAAVWPRLEFRTPWSRARELERTRDALARFLAWHHGSDRGLLATEAPFSVVVELDGGEQVELSGYADRLELDREGRVVVVDLKTARRAPSKPEVDRDPQLALYQYAVEAGAVADRLPAAGEDPEAPPPEGVRPGGAELVQLGLLEGGEAAKVQQQEPQDPDGPARRDLREALGSAARALRTETFPAVPGNHCRDCAFVAICPARGAGPVVEA